jgi:transposase
MLLTSSAGVDVAKAHLDVHLLPDGKRLRVPNTSDGHKRLIEFVTPISPGRVVVESTGGYENHLVFALLGAGLSVARVCPADVRHFARSRRQLAKNDKIDARVIAEFALHTPTRPLDPACKIRHVLQQLVTLRRQLIDQCVRLRNQLEHADVPMVIESIERSMKANREELKTVEGHIQAHINADEQLRSRQEALQKAIGVGPAVSAVLVSELPELGTLHRKKLASLVGVAPFDNDSGEHRGKRSIRGGRTTVRCALYMATLVAVRRDPHLRDHYQSLLARGKLKKVALVACMNKRLCYLNSLVRQPKST